MNDMRTVHTYLRCVEIEWQNVNNNLGELHIKQQRIADGGENWWEEEETRHPEPDNLNETEQINVYCDKILWENYCF